MEALIILTVCCVQKLQIKKLSKCLPPTNMWSLSALTRKYANTILFPLNVAWCSCDLFLQCFGVFSKYRLIYIATWCYIIFDATVSIRHNVTYDWFVGQLWQWLHWLTWKSFCFSRERKFQTFQRKFAGVKLIRVSHLSVIFRRWPLFKNFKQ